MAERPTRFEHHRFLGDKRKQVFYDLDDPALPQAVVDELMASEQFVCFAPDTPAEARNRCYRIHPPQADRLLADEAAQT